VIKEEMKRVISLKTGGQWLEKSANLPKTLFEDDCITTMNDIAETAKTKFAKHEITTVLHMKLMTVSDMTAILGDKEFRVSKQKLKKWQEEEVLANKGSAPSRVFKDHRKDNNPYLS
jgi:uncharacterized protein YjgD (DUF1641 family)